MAERRPMNDMRCFHCDKTGHIARMCPQRTWQEGRPRNEAHIVGEEWNEDEEKEEYTEIIGGYPVQTSKREYARRTPYPKKRPEPVVEIPVKEVRRGQPTEDEWEQAFNRANAETPPPDAEMNEAAKPPKVKKIKEYEYDPWNDLSNMQPNITFGQLLQYAPAMKQKVRNGIMAAKPKVAFAEINQVDKGESDNEEKRRSSTYTQ